MNLIQGQVSKKSGIVIECFFKIDCDGLTDVKNTHVGRHHRGTVDQCQKLPLTKDNEQNILPVNIRRIIGPIDQGVAFVGGLNLHKAGVLSQKVRTRGLG